MSEKVMIIMSGCSGSGKSTFIRDLCRDTGVEPIICSADAFMYEGDEYRWSFEKLSTAHQLCLRKAMNAAYYHQKTIIIDNTNMDYSSMLPYINVAKKNGYDVFRCVRKGGFKNVHNVPESTVLKQCLKYEKVDPEILPLFDEESYKAEQLYLNLKSEE